MNIITRFLLWRDKRALARIRLAASLVVSPDFVKGMSDDELAEFLIRSEKARAKAARDSARSLPTMAYDFEATWQAMVDFLEPEEVERRVQEYAESILETRMAERNAQ